MVHERREPTLSSTSVDASDKRAARPVSRTQPVRQVVVQKQSSGLLWFLFLLLLATAAATGYVFWLQYNAQHVINDQQARIDELENKLALSDDESTQSLTVLTANVKSLDKDVKLALAEVDKLWATRNVNKKAVEDVDKKLDDTIAKLNGVEQKTVKPVASLQQRSTEQELLIQSLRERQSEQVQSLKTLSQEAKSFAASVKKVDSLEQKVKSYDEAIRSIDQFRLSTNRDLLLLKQRAGVAPQ